MESTRTSLRKLPRLMALSPGNLASEQEPGLLRALERAVDAGLGGVLLREPRMPDGGFARLLEEVLKLRARTEAELWIGVHDRLHLALTQPVDGVHLGFRSLAPEVARGLCGSERRLGFSAHAGDEDRDLSACDYLFLAPVNRTASKPGASPLGLEGLGHFCQQQDVPTLALGGIEPRHVQRSLEEGAHGVAVLSGILGSEDAGRATRAYLAELP